MDVSSFIFPTNRTFPFDETCDLIVRRVVARGGEVPGLFIPVETHGYTNQVMIEGIYGQDFCIVLSQLPAGPVVSRLVIPGKELILWWRDRMLKLNLYVGDDWGRDREFFVRESMKYNARQLGAPRCYLPYCSVCDCSDTFDAAFENVGSYVGLQMGSADLAPTFHHHPSRWQCPILRYTDTLGTEYQPEDDEPMEFRTDAVLQEFTLWLQTQLLPNI